MYFCPLSFQLAASARARYSFCNSYNAVLIIILERVRIESRKRESEKRVGKESRKSELEE